MHENESNLLAKEVRRANCTVKQYEPEQGNLNEVVQHLLQFPNHAIRSRFGGTPNANIGEVVERASHIVGICHNKAPETPFAFGELYPDATHTEGHEVSFVSNPLIARLCDESHKVVDDMRRISKQNIMLRHLILTAREQLQSRSLHAYVSCKNMMAQRMLRQAGFDITRSEPDVEYVYDLRNQLTSNPLFQDLLEGCE